MKVFEPFRTYSSPSRRAVERIEPKASEPLPGSVIAQAPTFSSVRRSRAQRSFWAVVPRLMIAADVSPIDTPIAVTSPGLHRQSSMIGIIIIPPPIPPPPSPSSSSDSIGFGVSPAFSLAMRRSNCAPAMASRPNVEKSLRRMS